VSHRFGREPGWRKRKLAEAGSGIKSNDSFYAATAVLGEYRNRRNVWSIASEPSSEPHFASYPTALVRPMVLAASRPGDTVLDPFSGTGTTGVVAIDLGRQYIGIELNEQHAQCSRVRLARTTTGLPFDSEIPTPAPAGLSGESE
jgi:DNA modification methylase